MKTRSILHVFSKVWGIIFTLFMLLAIGSKMIMEIFEDSHQFLNELPETFSNWRNPTLYFLLYIIGYAVIWWKPLWGSIIIIIASIFYVAVAGLDGPPIFAAPGFLVGALYLINWCTGRKTQINSA
ncbi:MAG: hypothetical protein JW870_06115 [Candidatus Delongbacteria bacterium]|nr:hypothetical protein [Candidatus Delongbacteria bacterium]